MRLGTLTLWPLHQGLTEAFAALESQAGTWLPNPGDLIFISPRGSGDHSVAMRRRPRDFAKMAREPMRDGGALPGRETRSTLGNGDDNPAFKMVVSGQEPGEGAAVAPTCCGSIDG
eukprot:s411_g22.t1